MKRVMIIVLSALLLVYPHASYAASLSLEVSVDNTNWTATFSSVFGDGNAYKNASVLMIGPLDEPDDFEYLVSSVPEGKLYAEQTTLDETGNLNWQTNITSPDSFYVAAVKVEGQEKPLEISFMAYSQETASGALAAINAAADANALDDVFFSVEYEKMLVKNYPLFKLVTDNAKKQAIYNQIIQSRAVGGYATFDEYTQTFLPILTAQAVSGMADAQNIKEAAERNLALSGDNLYLRYAAMQDSTRLSVFKRLEGVSFTDPDDFLLQYSRCVFLQLVEDEGYAQNLTSLIHENAKRLGITDTGYTAVASKVNVDIMGKYYKDIDAFNIDFAKKIAAAGSDDGTSGSQTDHSNTNNRSGGSGSVLPSGTFAAIEPEVEDKVIFTDLKGCEWAKPYIVSLYENGIINGCGENRFCPDEYVKREELTKMLVSVLGLQDSTAKCAFGDTTTEDWYYPYIASAFKAGITKGIDESSFGVGRNITREDIAVMIWRQIGDTATETAAASFTDTSDISQYAREAVTKLSALGILSGTPDGAFHPKQPATRAEAAKMIGMFKQLLKERDGTK